MRELKWIEAIERVLKEHSRPLHYTEIAEQILENGYRSSVGSTPATTVNAYISNDIRDFGNESIFIKVAMGTFTLRERSNTSKEKFKKSEISYTSIINSYGMFWHRNQVFWNERPDLYGTQLETNSITNFKEQKGIYILYDGPNILYVGQAIEETIGEKLFGHTNDYLEGRWNRFSWFGIYEPDFEGTIFTVQESNREISIQDIVETMQVLLIETLEPKQNRDSRTLLSGLEFKQVEDPDLKRKRIQQILSEISTSY